MRKRFLSLAIAICMVAAMLPTFAVSASALEVSLDENGKISYYFYSYGTTNDDLVSKAALNTIAYNADKGRYWRYKQASEKAKTSQVQMNRINGNTIEIGSYIALEIFVPEDGIYSTEFYYHKLLSGAKLYGGKGNVYILPEGAPLIVNNDTIDIADVTAAGGIEIASVDYSPKDTTDGGKAGPVPAENVELKKGDNILLFVVTGQGEDKDGTYDYYTTPNSLTLTLIKKAPTEDEELTNAFTPDGTDDITDNYIAPTVSGLTTDGAINPVANGDGTYKITADAEKDGAKFLYWAKGMTTNKRIISFSNVIESYVPEEEGRNILIAVYEGEEQQVDEFYNANGQLIPGATLETTISMAGYGTTNVWERYGDTNIYVASYALEAPAKNIDITVTNGEGTGTYAYGDTVTCVADSIENFKCWKKNGEIVSRDTTYIFKAWEDCEIIAVNEEHTYNSETKKIVIDSFDVGSENGVMAEFIGFDSNVVEKGIMFTPTGETEATKIAMTKPGNQFSVIADANGTYVGYAILKNENAYSLITDGLVTISDEE